MYLNTSFARLHSETICVLKKAYKMQFHSKALCVLLFLSVCLFYLLQSSNKWNQCDRSKKAGKNEFIELKSTCGGVIPLRGYKIIGITGQSNAGTIDLVVTLWNERTDESGFCTIGGSEVSTANFRLPHEMV